MKKSILVVFAAVAVAVCDARNLEKFRMRAAFLDLGRQMETVDFIKDYIDFIADSGLNTLCLYFEGRLKTPTTQALPDAESYSPEDVAAIAAKARTRGVEIIPALEVLGHAEQFFRDGRLRHLSEERDGDGRWGGKAACGTFCPSRPEAKAFIARFLSEASALFPDARLVMVGLDEPWNMGFCKLCCARRKTEGFGGIFARHVDFVSCEGGQDDVHVRRLLRIFPGVSCRMSERRLDEQLDLRQGCDSMGASRAFCATNPHRLSASLPRIGDKVRSRVLHMVRLPQHTHVERICGRGRM